MKFTFETETELLPEQIRPYYEDVKQWYTWEDDLEDISLKGAFTTGTAGQMTLTNQPPLAFVLTSVEPNQSFTDKTTIPGVGSIFFHHHLKKVDSKTVVQHAVEFHPEDRLAFAEDIAFIAQIFADVPTSVFALIEAAK